MASSSMLLSCDAHLITSSKSPFLSGTEFAAFPPSVVSCNALSSSQESPRRGPLCVNSNKDLCGNERAEGTSRRSILSFVPLYGAAIGVASYESLFLSAGDSLAIQTSGGVAGRIPGLSEPDEEGLRTYKRPEGKSGGHGIGWSELIPYSFKVPDEWQEVPVSIADLGGTEIDLRFSSAKEGNISVVVAPVLRFSSTLGNDVKIEDIGDPEKVINAFGPELTGSTVEGKVNSSAVKAWAGRTYYQFELDPHILVSATAAGNRMYIMTVSASGRQWKKYAGELKEIANSFRVG
eukprot:TRINITY_DN32419_c0_g1_i1.p1 TRINITY_DN32419_c0_g1~~TRINITY_DN32419_c0_g1_i1.p1  ORF type:complete len:292 (+),score=45.41 TRINITY_DN32419_c0_g1_i1:200-1075(+)